MVLVCKGMPVWPDRGVTLLMHKTCYYDIAANLQRPATGNWCKDRNHGELVNSKVKELPLRAKDRANWWLEK